MKALLPLLLKRLHEYRGLIDAGAYYWSYANPQFFTLVHDSPLPTETDDTTLDSWGYRYNEVKPRLLVPAWMMMQRAREAATIKSSGKTKPRKSRMTKRKLGAPGKKKPAKSSVRKRSVPAKR
jgi:hypothetical protein